MEDEDDVAETLVEDDISYNAWRALDLKYSLRVQIKVSLPSAQVKKWKKELCCFAPVVYESLFCVCDFPCP
jgi:hypothetical protein